MNENNEHFFASTAMNFARGATRKAAMDRLMSVTDSSWVNNCLKAGTPLTIWTCRVGAPIEARYAIEWYMPTGVVIDQGENYMVTHKTKAKYAVMRDQHDEVLKLQNKLDATLLNAVVAA
jgi:hypothetical protein